MLHFLTVKIVRRLAIKRTFFSNKTVFRELVFFAFAFFLRPLSVTVHRRLVPVSVLWVSAESYNGVRLHAQRARIHMLSRGHEI